MQTVTVYTVQTRNWNSNKEAHKIFDQLVSMFGVVRWPNAAGDLDDKYQFTTSHKETFEKVKGLFENLSNITGGMVSDYSEEVSADEYFGGK